MSDHYIIEFNKQVERNIKLTIKHFITFLETNVITQQYTEGKKVKQFTVRSHRLEEIELLIS